MFALIYIFFACGESEQEIAASKEVDPTQFDQSCSIDEECSLAVVGNTCGCNCNYTGINISESDAWSEVYQEAEDNCTPEDDIDCFACPPIEAYCNNGMCSARSTED